MSQQQRRDDKTLDIATALLVIVGVVGAGGIALALASVIVDLDHGVATGVLRACLYAGAALAVVYLVRQRLRR